MVLVKQFKREYYGGVAIPTRTIEEQINVWVKVTKANIKDIKYIPKTKAICGDIETAIVLYEAQE